MPVKPCEGVVGDTLWGMDIANIKIHALVFAGGLIYIALNTLRNLFIQRGQRALAPVVAFLEVGVFLLAVGQVLTGPPSVTRTLTYAAGFAAGTVVGMLIEQRLAIGNVIARIITQRDAEALIDDLREAGFGLTFVRAQGLSGDVQILYSVMPRRLMSEFLTCVRRHNPKAFVTFEDIRGLTSGWLPPAGPVWPLKQRNEHPTPPTAEG